MILRILDVRTALKIKCTRAKTARGSSLSLGAKKYFPWTPSVSVISYARENSTNIYLPDHKNNFDPYR